MQHQRDQRGTCIVARKAPILSAPRWAANRQWGRLAGSRGPSSPRQGSWQLARPQPMVAPAQRIGPVPALSEGAHSPSWANGRAAAANQPPPHRHAGVRWRPCQYRTRPHPPLPGARVAAPTRRAEPPPPQRPPAGGGRVRTRPPLAVAYLWPFGRGSCRRLSCGRLSLRGRPLAALS